MIKKSSTSHLIAIDSVILKDIKLILKNNNIKIERIYTPRKFLCEFGTTTVTKLKTQYNNTFKACKGESQGICAISAYADPNDMEKLAKYLFETTERLPTPSADTFALYGYNTEKTS